MKLCKMIVSGVFGLAGVIIGALISCVLDRRREKTRLMADLFGDIKAAYMHWLMVSDEKTTTICISAIERARLLCTGEIDNALEELGHATVKDPEDKDLCIARLYQFDKLARKALKK